MWNSRGNLAQPEDDGLDIVEELLQAEYGNSKGPIICDSESLYIRAAREIQRLRREL